MSRNNKHLPYIRYVCELIMFVSCKWARELVASLGHSLFAKALSCAVSVVKGWLCFRWSSYKPCTKGDQCFCGYQRPFWQIDVLPFCLTVNMIPACLKSSILGGFCKLNCRWSPFQESSVFLVSIIFCIQTRHSDFAMCRYRTLNVEQRPRNKQTNHIEAWSTDLMQ